MPAATDLSSRIISQIHRRVVGQEAMVERLLIGLLTGGHVLFEGVPGLAKTLTVKTLAETIDASFQRIQFTPDLLPADVVGTVVYNAASGAFTPHRGPIFAHIVLADEINRAPAKVQAALLEAMQERQVTVGGETFALPDPFLVLATQNPIEQEGTYPLPEAQVDRFMLKVVVGYPTRQEEKEILRLASQGAASITPVATPGEILEARAEIARVYLDEKVGDYILDIVSATRDPAGVGLDDLVPLIEFGASPRATLALGVCARAHAWLRGRNYATPDDVKAMAPDVLRHRVITTYEAEAEQVTSDDVVTRVLERIATP
jgi:MoxR-like ATPase